MNKLTSQNADAITTMSGSWPISELKFLAKSTMYPLLFGLRPGPYKKPGDEYVWATLMPFCTYKRST